MEKTTTTVRRPGLGDYLFASPGGGQFGFTPSALDTAKTISNSPGFKAAKLGFNVAGQQKMQQPMEVDTNEIMDPETMALMRMGGRRR
jgi:hypothetical protein